MYNGFFFTTICGGCQSTYGLFSQCINDIPRTQIEQQNPDPGRLLLSLRDVQGPAADFTDRGYQELLPTLARSTASRAIKNNLRTTEIMAEPDISTNQKRAEVILHRHLEHKAEDRVLNPGRSSGGGGGGGLRGLEGLSGFLSRGPISHYVIIIFDFSFSFGDRTFESEA